MHLKNLFYGFLALSFISCKKVIELKLKDNDPKYVIEGIVTNEPGGCRVKITTSKQFYENNIFAGVSGAIVRIKNNGTDFLLTETSPGIYENTAVTGVPGYTYELTVTVANNVFTAISTMPQPVRLDTLYISPGPFGQFKFATIAFTDQRNVANNYRFVQYLNGVKDPAIFSTTDEFSDGQKVSSQLDTGVDKKDDPRSIKSGDMVTIEMLGIDAAVYRYWYSLQSNGGNGNGNVASPANPITNIKGGALGYFSAQTIDRRTVIVP